MRVRRGIGSGLIAVTLLLPLAFTVAEEEYNLANYPDAEELEARGYYRPDQPPPYFTWRDAEGNVRTSYYVPAVRKRPHGAAPDPSTLSPATIYTPGDALQLRYPSPGEPNAGQGIDPFQLLGLDTPEDDMVTLWQGNCCEALALEDVVRWRDNREFPVTIDDSSPRHDFIWGVSAYRWVRLPPAGSSYDRTLQIRSFIDKGMFVPTLVFLDEDLQVQRIVTELAGDYQPRRWHRRGYVETRVRFDGEQWLLVLTREEDAHSQTVIESPQGPEVIPHSPHGLLSLQLVP
ncbi:MAG: MalM family protein [Marinobacter sp.]|nr:MalM family protein [Marinobacter sp.]